MSDKPISYNYFERCGIEFDVAVNVLFGGNLGETVSMRAAVAERDGKTWGCWFCWLLARLVQRGHCLDQFLNNPSPVWVYLRAGLAFAVAILASVAILYALVQLVERLI